MSPHDSPHHQSEHQDEHPGEYRYRYKYLYKYADERDEKAGKPPEGDEKQDEGKQDRRQNGDKDPEQQRKKKRKRIIVIGIIAGVFVLAGLIWLLLYLFVFSKRETTDDAYVRGNLVTISPRVPGTVVEIAVDETERVHAGQVLLRLDPADAQVTLMNAQG